MSKDPAFLFYSSDFLTGTALMTDEQIGKYIKLLCYQHQIGHLSERDMLKICKTHDEDIFSKFEKDENGLFYNARLKQEVEKRKAYSESRRQNRSKKDMNNISKTYVQHMENENENVIVNKNRNTIKNTIPNLDEFLKQGNECLKQANKSGDFTFSLTAKYEQWVADGWKDGHGSKIKNWKTKLKNTVPYLNPSKQSAKQDSTGSWLAINKKNPSDIQVCNSEENAQMVAKRLNETFSYVNYEAVYDPDYCNDRLKGFVC